MQAPGEPGQEVDILMEKLCLCPVHNECAERWNAENNGGGIKPKLRGTDWGSMSGELLGKHGLCET